MKKRMCSVTGETLEIDWGYPPGIEGINPNFAPPPNASVSTTYTSFGGASALGSYPPVENLCVCHGLPVLEVDD
jgi:hypothetical protein